jgi:hypothetical protein
MSSGLKRASELENFTKAAPTTPCCEVLDVFFEDDLGVAGGGASGEDSLGADFKPFRFELFFFLIFCTLAGFGAVVAAVVFSAFAFDFDFWAFLLVVGVAVAGADLAGAAAEDGPDLVF